MSKKFENQFPVSCPHNPGLACPALKDVVAEYAAGNSAWNEIPDSLQHMINAGLRERRRASELAGCIGLDEDNDCSVRQEVSESPLRSTYVKPAKFILKRLLRLQR